MSRLFLLRHAKAAWAKPGMKDFDRPLDEEGIASLMRLARSMKEAGLFPDRVVLSASVRTRETAFGLIERLGIDVETIIDETIYSGGPGQYMQSIRQHGDVGNLMLTGHNPSIEDLALALCSDGEPESIYRLNAGFPTAALATISFEGALTNIEPGRGFLESFLLSH
ncbi:histidine phosphatase family protein [Brucella sp. 6810]|uniref:SixA phosphatase family protein n=1 Tax=unclassified Brucella TaxID=2632610 RepID=UPI001296977D|nr:MULTISPECIES: histidine phosphatase family protein [unclassified Brucella]QGA55799.1 histidine phosphatase family protein [Brucella sp. 2280]QNQ62580.1 histidine phosphatase family protein [Brucella sp. 6810]QTN98822.1 histidine phosphatase family protein [Brucella sp. 458]UWF59772.1 histidine phosphatase family protein [Brucella sp. 2716]